MMCTATCPQTPRYPPGSEVPEAGLVRMPGVAYIAGFRLPGDRGDSPVGAAWAAGSPACALWDTDRPLLRGRTGAADVRLRGMVSSAGGSGERNAAG